MKFLAKTFHGLENILAKELSVLGAQEVAPIKRAVTFEGDKELLYKANLHLRTALRVLVPIVEFTANTDLRSEEHRVGKECRSRWSPYH